MNIKEKQKQIFNKNRERIKEQLLQKQSEGQINEIDTPTITPTSTTNLFSTKLRRLNNYPEWDTYEGIDNVIKSLLNFDKFTPTQKKKFLVKFKNFYVIKNELFYGIKANGNDENYNIILQVVRPDDKDKIMTEIYQDDKLGLGLGITQFYYQICRKYLNITRKDATLFLKKQVDMTRCRESVDNSRYIAFLTIVDFFSKKVWAIPNKDLEASSNFEAFMSICRKENTYPQIIRVDNGSSFYGDFKDLMNKHNEENPNNKIKIIYTTPYTPTANGLVERMNRELRKKIRAGFIRHDNLNWVDELNTYCDNINNQRSSNTKYTPNQIWTAGYNKTEGTTSEPITEETNLENRRLDLKNQLLKNSFKQFKNQQKAKEYKIGDIVRLKLSANPTDRTLYSKVRTREKDKADKKYNVVNFSTTLFRIKQIFPSKIVEQNDFKSLQNHLTKTEMNNRLQNQYSLEEKTFTGSTKEEDKYETYRIQVQKKKLQATLPSVQDKDKEKDIWYVPKFFANDLVAVPENSTKITIEPSNANIARLNTFNYKKEDAIVAENERAGIKPIKNRLRTRIKKEKIVEPRITRSKSNKTPKVIPPEVIPPEVIPKVSTRVLRSQTKSSGSGLDDNFNLNFRKRSSNLNFLPITRFAGGSIMCLF